MPAREFVNAVAKSLFLALWLVTTISGHPSDAADDDRPRIVAFGDSLTAGLGVAAEDAYPARLEHRLHEHGLHYRVINAGVSGDTTAGGVRRVDWVLKSRPDLVILELGANDGLRGLSLHETKANLERIIRRCQEASVGVVLAGMKLPPNYGMEYTKGFEAIFPTLAKQYRVTLIPFFLDGVAGSASLNQADGIHPTSDGYRIIADKILETVKPLLNGRK
jgi:acyl-CoA thioesterase I